MDASSLRNGLENFDHIKAKLDDTGLILDNYVYALILLAALPVDQHASLQAYEQTCFALGDELTCSKVREDIRIKIQQLKTETKGDKEVAFKSVEKENVKCFICKKKGHYMIDCTRYDPNYKKKRFKDESREKNYRAWCGESSSEEESEQASMAYVNDENSVNINGTQFTYSNVMHDTRKGDGDMNKFILDSGATSHMTHRRDIMYDLRPCDKNVEVGDGTVLKGIGIGSINLINKIGKRMVITNVIYVPDLNCNLISVARLQAANYTVAFRGGCKYTFVKDRQGRRHLSAKLDNKLYTVQAQIETPNKHMLEHAKTSMELWHGRLGHIAYETMRKIPQLKDKITNQEMEKPKNTMCKGCNLGKMQRRRRKTYRIHKATEILEVVHTDVAGPFPKGYGGFRYLIVFVDEKSRRGHVYFMKNKSDAFRIFKQFKARAENERKEIVKRFSFSRSARRSLMRIQSENGGEYISNEFENYLKDNGIQHYTSNADEPRQNGIAERYIGNLLC